MLVVEDFNNLNARRKVQYPRQRLVEDGFGLGTLT